MPMYEYIAEDGETIELLRPMKDADAPVDDPKGKGRAFTRKLSTFMTGSSAAGGSGHVHGGGCGCGNPHGPCSN